MRQRAHEVGGECSIARAGYRRCRGHRSAAAARSGCGDERAGVNADRFGVLVADDHQLFRDGLRSLVLAMPDAELVGEAADGLEAVALAAAAGRT